LILGSTAVGAAALTYYMTRKNAPIDPLYDFDNQSTEIDVNILKSNIIYYSTLQIKFFKGERSCQSKFSNERQTSS
jgi:hypothetical protein